MDLGGDWSLVPSFLVEICRNLMEGLMLLISYISNGTTFAQPLSKKEEKEWLEKLTKGDIEAKEKLIEHNMRLVAHIVKKFENANLSKLQYKDKNKSILLPFIDNLY